MIVLATFGAALLAAGAQGEPLKVYILAGQSNMEGHARIETFDYIGDDPKTAPMLKDHANKDGTMTKVQQQACVREYRAKLVTEEDDAFWKHAASHQGYHYFGSARTLGQIGKASAEAMLGMEKK